MLIGHTGIRGPQMTRFVTEDSGQDDGWIRSSLMVEPGWIDYNGHMNVAFYVLAFDRATDVFLDHVGLGEQYLQLEGGSTFTAEMNVSYIREVRKGDGLRFETRLLGYDDKRIHYFHSMYHSEEGYLAATNECLSLHMNMQTRRVAQLPEGPLNALERLKRDQEKLPIPDRLGRKIALGRHKF